VVSDESDFQTHRLFSVIVLEDDTNVLMQNGTRSWITFNGMQRGQVVTYLANSWYISSAEVQATKNVAVISGTVCGYGWLVIGDCNHQAIMLMPFTVYGTQFALVPFAGARFSEYTVTPLADNTTIYIDFNNSLTINQLGWVRLWWDNEILTTSKPVQVVQVGSRLNNTYGDPFFVHNPALPNHMLNSGPVQFATGFDTFNQDSITHYVRIVTPIETIGKFAIDGYTVNSLLYTRVGNSKFYYYEQKIIHGTHTVTPMVSGANFTVTAFGYGNRLGYGFMAGLELPCVAINREAYTLHQQSKADF